MSPLLAVLLLSATVGAPSESSLLRDLEGLDRLLLKKDKQIHQLQNQEKQLETDLSSLSTDVAALRVRTRKVQGQFKTRIRALAKMPTGARLLFLGTIKSLGDFLESSRLLRQVARHDRKMALEYRDAIGLIAEQEAQIEKQQAALNALQYDQRRELGTLAEKRRDRLKFLTSISSDRSLSNRIIDEKSYARKELAALIRRMIPKGQQHDNFARNRGRLPWPGAGKVGLAFGRTVESGHGTTTIHNGIDIEAPPGSPAQAIAKGKVVFADWLRGYGQLVIIDHDSGYHSLMAHLGKIEVQPGDEVTEGQEIGRVGDTGSLRGTVLYFELRLNGKAQDPLPWLRI